MDNSTFERVVEHLQKYALRSVDLVGGGEITLGPRWRERCERLLGLGFALSTTINMAKALTAEEISTLSRFDVVNVSIDTVDPEVLRRVRVGTDLRNVVYNLMMLRAAQIGGGTRKPALGITAVYSAEIVRGIDRLVAFAIAAGASSFGIQDLVEYGEVEHNVGSVWTLTGEDALDAARRTKRALKMARDANMVVLVQPEFEERLEALERRATTGSSGLGRIAGLQEATYMKAVPPGFTRDCTDPWTFIHVLGDGTLRPCCFSSVALGRLDSATTFETIQNSDTARRLRNELLTGNLDHHCSICSLRSQIRVEAFRQRIAQLMEMAERCRRQGQAAGQAAAGGVCPSPIVARFLAGRRMRRQMAAIVETLKRRDIHKYYIYGTGEYARRFCQYIEDEDLPQPAGLIEEHGILARKGNPSHSMRIPIVADRDVISTLTPDDCIVVGSPTYCKEITARLRQQGCRASVVDPVECE